MPLRLDDRRTQLLAAYAALLTGAYAIYLLPGLPYFRSGGELVFSLAIDVVLVIFIARGSRTAIAIALGLNLFFFAAIVAVAVSPPEAGVAALLAVKLAETVVLVALWRIVERSGDRPVT